MARSSQINKSYAQLVERASASAARGHCPCKLDVGTHESRELSLHHNRFTPTGSQRELLNYQASRDLCHLLHVFRQLSRTWLLFYEVQGLQSSTCVVRNSIILQFLSVPSVMFRLMLASCSLYSSLQKKWRCFAETNLVHLSEQSEDIVLLSFTLHLPLIIMLHKVAEEIDCVFQRPKGRVPTPAHSCKTWSSWGAVQRRRHESRDTFYRRDGDQNETEGEVLGSQFCYISSS